MTLHIGAEHGTDEWHDERRGVLTASVVGQLLTPSLRVADNDTSRALTTTLVAERIAGWTEDNYVNNDMLRGIQCEPIARDLYSEHYEAATECGFMRRDEDTWTLGYSPDAVVGSDGLLEIKVPRAKGHIRTILADEVPARHLAQCQAGLLVSGREWLDFVSFCGGLPLYVKRVLPDPQWFEAITSAAETFAQTAAEMVAAYTSAVAGLPSTERVVDLDVVI